MAIDDPALRVCRDNVALNTARDIVVGKPDSAAGQCYDLMVANILLDPLTALVAQFAALLRPGGTIVLAGLLADQVAYLLAAYSGTFKMHVERQLGEWAIGRRRSRAILNPAFLSYVCNEAL